MIIRERYKLDISSMGRWLMLRLVLYYNVETPSRVIIRDRPLLGYLYTGEMVIVKDRTML